MVKHANFKSHTTQFCLLIMFDLSVPLSGVIYESILALAVQTEKAKVVLLFSLPISPLMQRLY